MGLREVISYLNYTFVVLFIFVLLFALILMFIRNQVIVSISDTSLHLGNRFEVRFGWQIAELILNKYSKNAILISKKKMYLRMFQYNRRKKILIIDHKYYYGKSIISHYYCMLIAANVIWIYNNDVRRIFVIYSWLLTRLLAIAITFVVVAFICLGIQSSNAFDYNSSLQQIWSSYYAFNLIWIFLLYYLSLFIVHFIWKSFHILSLKIFLKKQVSNYFNNQEILFLNKIFNIDMMAAASKMIGLHLKTISYFMRRIFFKNSVRTF